PSHSTMPTCSPSLSCAWTTSCLNLASRRSDDNKDHSQRTQALLSAKIAHVSISSVSASGPIACPAKTRPYARVAIRHGFHHWHFRAASKQPTPDHIAVCPAISKTLVVPSSLLVRTGDERLARSSPHFPAQPTSKRFNHRTEISSLTARYQPTL